MKKRRKLTRLRTKATAVQREEASATKLLVKMESTGLSAKKLLEKGMTTKRQIMALRRCDARDEQERRRKAEEEAAAAEKKAKQEKAMEAMAGGA
jgi:hypothetical protein